MGGSGWRGVCHASSPGLLFNTFSTSLLARAMACDGMWRLKEPSLVPRPHPAFRRLQYGKVCDEKQGRAWERGYKEPIASGSLLLGLK